MKRFNKSYIQLNTNIQRTYSVKNVNLINHQTIINEITDLSFLNAPIIVL